MNIKDRITRLNANVIEFRNTQFLIKEDTFDKRTNEIYDYYLITIDKNAIVSIHKKPPIYNKTTQKWESIDAKELHIISQTVTCFDCIDCSNCMKCKNCTTTSNCSNCSNCTHCINCYSIIDCQNCDNCTKCYKCYGCHSCMDCEKSFTFDYCYGCIDCNRCRYSSNLNNEYGKYDTVVKIIGANND